MKNKIKELRTKYHITQAELSKFLGIAQNTLSYWEQGKYDIDNLSLQKLSAYFNVSIDFLLGNEDYSMYEDSIKPSPNGVLIPVLGHVAAGIPIEAVEEILDYEEIPKKLAASGTFFALKIKGDSMAPRMLSGDVVIVKKQPDANSGDIVIAAIDGQDSCCKKLIKYDDGISLVSLNPNYDPLIFTNKEVMELPVTIIGKVVELRGKF